jgi:hypothetical protein
MPIVTAVAWSSECGGGEFVFYPDGADAPGVTLPARRNTAVVLDTDTVFHGVAPVALRGPMPALRPGMQLTFDGDGRWSVRADGAPLATWRSAELRFSVSWKAYCFADDAERRAWREHADDLGLGFILDRLVEDLRARGRIRERPDDTTLALALIDEYVRFPAG